MIDEGIASCSGVADGHGEVRTKAELEKDAESINHPTRAWVHYVEHDETLPPIGKTLDGRVAANKSGEFDLEVRIETFEGRQEVKLPDGSSACRQESASDRRPFARRREESQARPALILNIQNFESAEDANQLVTELKELADFDAYSVKKKGLITTTAVILYTLGGGVLTYYVGRTGKKYLDNLSDEHAKAMTEETKKFGRFVIETLKKFKGKLKPDKALEANGDANVVDAEVVEVVNQTPACVGVFPGEPVVHFILRDETAENAFELDVIKERLEYANRLKDAFNAVFVAFEYTPSGWEFSYLLTDTGAIIATKEVLNRRDQLNEQVKLICEKNGTPIGISLGQ